MLASFKSAKLTYLFDLLDINGNGFLQLNDFVQLADNVRKILNYEEGEKEHQAISRKSIKFFHKLLRDIPNPGDQSINLASWLQFFEEEVTSFEDEDTVDEWVDLLLAFVFGMFDENHDGYISLAEYQDLFTIFGKDGAFSKVAFDKIDINKDGKLSRYELIPAVETFLTSSNPDEYGNWVFGDWRKV
ncbi:MAG: Ca2+-binding EF-hand superfamily protein [Cyclobacteriaceae bacterium]|jgi:Ca2+-binding EF-hand superfamily protein